MMMMGTGGAGPITGIQLMVNPAVITMREGDMQTFMVTLASAARSQLTVNVASSDTTAAAAQQDTVTFEMGETGPKSVVVLAPQDVDLANESATISLSGEGVRSAQVRVQVTDNDMQAIVLSPSTQVTVTEGLTAQVGVSLRHQPAAAVTLAVASANPAKLTSSAAMLTFDTDNYSTPQFITLSALQDADLTTDMINLTVSAPAGSDTPAATLPVRITDDDVLNIEVTPGSLALNEAMAAGQALSVKLTRPPAADIVVTVVSSKPTKATTTPGTLTFTPGNFGIAQMVTVAPVADDSDNKDETLTVDLNAPGVEMAQSVAVTVTDDDKQAIQITPASMTLVEGQPLPQACGATMPPEPGCLGIALAFDPGASTTVNIFSSNASKVEITPSALVFTPENYQQVQFVKVQALEDEDLVNESATLTLISTVADGRTVPITVNDNDMQRILLVNTGDTMSMPESRPGSPSNATVGFRLAYRPSAAVPVDISIGQGSPPVLSRTPNFVTFDPIDYAIPKFVNLTALDEDNLNPDTAVVTFSAPQVPDKMLTVNITDTDVQGIQILDGTGMNVLTGITLNEQSNDACGALIEQEVSFQVKLNFPPTSAVTLSFVPMPAAGGNAQFTVTPPVNNMITGSEALTASVKSTVDCNTVGGAGVIRISGSGLLVDLPVTVVDQDVMQVVLTPGAGASLAGSTVTATISEDSSDTTPTPGMAAFRVCLTKDPVPPNPTISVIPSASGIVGVSAGATGDPVPPSTSGLRCIKTGMTVTDGGFNVTVAGAQDPNLVPESLTIRISAPALGVPDQFVSVTEIDDDIQGITVNPTTRVNIAEGMTETFTVVLTQQPVTATPVEVKVPDNLVGSFSVSSDNVTFVPSLQLSFTPENYATTQTVWVRAIHDTNTVDEEADISVANQGFASNKFLSVKAIEDDQQAIVLSSPSVMLTEKSQTGTTTMMTVNVHLAFQPHGAPPEGEVITFMSSSTLRVTVSPATLTFLNNELGADGWNVNKTITITSVLDPDALDDNATIMASSSLTTPSDDWDATPVMITASVDDQDVQSIMFSSIPASLGEGGSDSVGIRLQADPRTDVTITCTSNNSDVDIDNGPTYTFTAGPTLGTWDDVQNIDISVDEDDTTADNETGTITCTAIGMGMPAIPMNTFDISVIDDETELTVNVTTPGGEVDSTGSDTGDIVDCRMGPMNVCNHVYTAAENVNLDANPDMDWVFGEWMGTGCFADGEQTDETQTVSVAVSRTCLASFRPTLTVTVDANGTVTSTPLGRTMNIDNCRDDTCTDNFTYGEMVNLTITPDMGFVYTGTCMGTYPSLTAPVNCNATFAPAP
jgi:hypothetical protein